MARCRFAGLDSTAEDALSALSGSGSTPRDGAGEIAQVAAASPRPASIWTSTPPKECPMMAGLRSSCSMIIC